MTIHRDHPFADPNPDPVRRLRGRVSGTVSLWTAGTGRRRAGLTVSSFLVVAGEPGRVVAMLDPDADLTERMQETGRGVVQLLAWEQRGLADAFAGVAPAPGGPFTLAEFAETDHGPRLVTTQAWAAVEVESTRPLGWSLEVVATIASVVLGDAETAPLVHRRGRYVRP